MIIGGELLLPVLIGLLLIGYAMKSGFAARRARYWPAVQAEVIESDVFGFEDPEKEGGMTYLPRVIFEWRQQGQTKRGTELSVDEHAYRFSSQRAAWRVVSLVPAGAQLLIPCSTEGRAVLFSDIDSLRKSHYLAVFVGGCLCIALGIFLFWYRYR